MSANEMPTFVTVRVSDDEFDIPLECRFADGQKFAAVQVAAGYDHLADQIAKFLNALAAKAVV